MVRKVKNKFLVSGKPFPCAASGISVKMRFFENRAYSEKNRKNKAVSMQKSDKNGISAEAGKRRFCASGRGKTFFRMKKVEKFEFRIK